MTSLDEQPTSTEWTPAKAEALYGVGGWSGGYARVSGSGTVCMRPRGPGSPEIDLDELVRGLSERGLETPLLLRFDDVLHHRLGEIARAFRDAIEEEAYDGHFAGVFPIKVNQQRHVCEEILEAGAPLGFGLEAGSKPELLAVLALTARELQANIPIVCNGFKDKTYADLVALCAKLGRDIVPVVERFAELELLLEASERWDADLPIGVRTRPTTKGSGRWQESAGPGSKFGLQAAGLLRAVETLRARGKLDRLRLVHCHIGSQVADISAISPAIDELTRVYCELRKLGAPIDRIDIGGGMGVDYEGTRSPSGSSVNYSLREYALDVIHRIKAVCDEAGEPHPGVIAECGRAMTAHASVLVFDLLEPARPQPGLDTTDAEIEAFVQTSTPSRPLRDLIDAFKDSHAPSDLDAAASLWHDAERAGEECESLFRLGHLSLAHRAAANAMVRIVGLRALDAVGDQPMPPALEGLADRLADQFHANCSVFQSLPDHWAIGQLFPVMPIHRLSEKPPRLAVLGDMTCDSDGRIDRFPGIGGNPEPAKTLPLHDPAEGGPGGEGGYHLGAFLVGAYQEVLGDLHNLFGDTHAVHIRLTGDNSKPWAIDEVVEGDRCREVLGYVQYESEAIRRAMRADVERATRNGTITPTTGRALLARYDAALDGTTYMER
ncbi:MAG: biosynthetic arginine decarboxylase [Planctomycetota bacterium]